MNKHLLHRGSKTVIAAPTVFALLLSLMLMGCSTETIFKSNFNPATLGNLPAHAQDVGTIDVDAPAGLVKVVASPQGTSDKWVQVTRQSSQTSVSGIRCTDSKFIGYGTYYFSAVMYIPAGSGLATIQFEPFTIQQNAYINFMHIDFTQDNKVRIDDNDATKFGSFTRNKAFIVQVTLNLAASGSTANIALAGDGATGSADYTIPHNPFINQFGAVRLWMGFPWEGNFDAYNIVVTHKTN